jgi:hypothetical protein
MLTLFRLCLFSFLISFMSCILFETPVITAANTIEQRIAGTRRAVIVGVSGYPPRSGLPEIQAAASDAEKLANSLIRAGYRRENVQLVSDGGNEADSRLSPSRDNILTAVRAMATAPDLSPEDSLVFAFIGHAFTDGNGSQLRTIESGRFLKRLGSLPVAEITRLLAASPAGTKLLIFDACRNERVADSTSEFNLIGDLPRLPLPQKDTAVPASGLGIAFLSSCLTGQRSHENLDGELAGGVFVHFLVEGLEGEADYESGNHDGVVTLHELSAYVTEKTSRYAHSTFDAPQTPWSSSHSTSRFVLNQLSEETRQRLRSKHGDKLTMGLELAARQQADTLVDAAIGALAAQAWDEANNLATAAVERDPHCYLARRIRAIIHLTRRFANEQQAASAYSDAIEEMGKVGSPLRITLDSAIELPDLDDSTVERGDVLLIDQLQQDNEGSAHLRVTGVQRLNRGQDIGLVDKCNSTIHLAELLEATSQSSQLSDLQRVRKPRSR